MTELYTKYNAVRTIYVKYGLKNLQRDLDIWAFWNRKCVRSVDIGTVWFFGMSLQWLQPLCFSSLSCYCFFLFSLLVNFFSIKSLLRPLTSFGSELSCIDCICGIFWLALTIVLSHPSVFLCKYHTYSNPTNIS